MYASNRVEAGLNLQQLISSMGPPEYSRHIVRIFAVLASDIKSTFPLLQIRLRQVLCFYWGCNFRAEETIYSCWDPKKKMMKSSGYTTIEKQNDIDKQNEQSVPVLSLSLFQIWLDIFWNSAVSLRSRSRFLRLILFLSLDFDCCSLDLTGSVLVFVGSLRFGSRYS